MSESELEIETEAKGLVTNYGNIPTTYKQWLASIAAARAAWHGINQNQNSWTLATTQSKLNVLDAIWQDGLEKLRNEDVLNDMGL